MIIELQPGHGPSCVKAVLQELATLGFEGTLVEFPSSTVIVVPAANQITSSLEKLETMPGVQRLLAIDGQVQLGSRQFIQADTEVALAPGIIIGGRAIGVIAGPCAVENEEQIVATARAVAAAGACALRGGAFKPRSSVYSFQGLGREGMRLLRIASQETQLPIVTEVLDCESLDAFFDDIDVVQIGARSMQNFPLLRAVGEAGKPVLLKRSMMATVDELLQAAEYILATGNSQVILCERGIRTFETSTRNSLDLNAVAVLKERTHLPVIVDPSHGTGCARFVPALSKAAIACGADGLLVEVHVDPSVALSDGAQSLAPDSFTRMMGEIKKVAAAVDRPVLRHPLESVQIDSRPGLRAMSSVRNA